MLPLVPSPNWPSKFPPQHLRPPAVLRAHVWPPAAMAATPVRMLLLAGLPIEKVNDADPTRAAMAALNTEPENFRMIVVVDSDIDVYDEKEVSWAIGTRFDAERDLQIIPHWNGPGGLLPTNWEYDDQGEQAARMSSAVIVDATKPAPPIKFPSRAYVPAQARAEVDPSATRDLTPDAEALWQLFS